MVLAGVAGWHRRRHGVGCGDGRRCDGKPDVVTVPSLGRDGSGGRG